MAAAASSGLSDRGWPQVLADRNSSNMPNVVVPDEGREYLLVLPQAHFERWIEERNDMTDAERQKLRAKADLASFIASMPDEDWYEDMNSLVLTLSTPTDRHCSRQWSWLAGIWLYRSEDLGADCEMMGHTVAFKTLQAHSFKEGGEWPSPGLVVAPRPDRLYQGPVFLSAQEGLNWVQFAGRGDLVHAPFIRQVAGLQDLAALQQPVYCRSELRPVGMTNQLTAAQIIKIPVPPNTVQAAKERSAKNKPGKHQRERKRAQLLALTVLRADQPAATADKNASSSTSDSSESPSSSSSDESESDSPAPSNKNTSMSTPADSPSLPSNQVASSLANQELPATLHPDTPMVRLQVVESSPLQSANISAAPPATQGSTAQTSFTFAPLQPPVRYADLFRDEASQPARRVTFAPAPAVHTNSVPAAATVPPVNTSQAPAAHTQANAQASTATNTVPVDITERPVSVERLVHRIKDNFQLQQEVCDWFCTEQSLATMPEVFMDLSGRQLTQVKKALEPWILHRYQALEAAAQAPSPSIHTVSPASPDIVHGTHSMGQADRNVSVGPAQEQEPAHSVQQVNVPAPANGQPQQVQVQLAPHQGRGKGRIKLPALSHFNGDAASSKLKIVMQWLRQMHLALQQEQATDPVSIAIMHLDGNAANWRDTVSARKPRTSRSMGRF